MCACVCVRVCVCVCVCVCVRVLDVRTAGLTVVSILLSLWLIISLMVVSYYVASGKGNCHHAKLKLSTRCIRPLYTCCTRVCTCCAYI